MEKHNLDILCLQETKVNCNSREIQDDYILYWSTGVPDDARNKAENLKRSGKANIHNPERTFRAAIEHLWATMRMPPAPTRARLWRVHVEFGHTLRGSEILRFVSVKIPGPWERAV